MSNVSLQALNCKLDQVTGLIPVIDVDGQRLACLEGRTRKLKLVPTIEQYKALETELVKVLARLNGKHIAPKGRVESISNVDGSKFFIIKILLPTAADLRLILIEVEHMQIVPRMFETHQQAEGVAGELMETIAGGVVDWTRVKNITMK